MGVKTIFEYSDVILSVLGGLVTLFFGVDRIRKWIKRYRQRQVRAGLQESTKAAHEVYSCLVKLIFKSGVDRVMVLKCKNGGGIPGKASKLYISAEHEVFSPVLPAIRESFQDFPIDHAYTLMLQDLMSERFKVLKTDELPDGHLKVLYETQKIRVGYVALIGYSTDGMYYIAAQSKRENENTAKIRGEMSLAAGQIASVLDLLSTPPALKEDV